jgi:hypothetical protein
MNAQFVTSVLGLGFLFLIYKRNEETVKLLMAGKSYPAIEAQYRFQETNDMVSYGHPGY